VFGVLLTAEAIALAVFLAMGMALSPDLLFDVQEDLILPIGISGVIAMAIQNALMKEAKGVFKSYIPTTVMTGNTTQLTIDVVQFFLAKFASTQTEATQMEASESLERICRFVPTIAGFALGGLLAACFILVSESWWSLSLPLIIISILAIAAYVEHGRKPIT
jgi:uncharacterized membrane protein YoaK (UPF0700 family)